MTTGEQMPGQDPMTHVPPGFVDAVMRSVADAPRPSPARAFTSALRDRSTTEAQGALGVAWRLIRASATMPTMVRAQALALLLLVGGSVVGGSALAAVATYQAVVPIVRLVVDPTSEEERAIPEPAEPTSAPTPTPVPAVAPAADDDAPVAAPTPTTLAEDDEDGVEDEIDAQDDGDDGGTDDPGGDDRVDPDTDDADADEATDPGTDDPATGTETDDGTDEDKDSDPPDGGSADDGESGGEPDDEG